MIQKFTVSRDDSIYEAFPDITLTADGRLLCVFEECTHHGNRDWTRLALTESSDRGRTWSPKRGLTEPSHGRPYWNCARITTLRDGRIAAIADNIGTDERSKDHHLLKNFLFLSHDHGRTWDEPVLLPMQGIMPDKLIELSSGRWLTACHVKNPDSDFLKVWLWHSDDQGKTWHGPVTVADHTGLNLCEISILPVDDQVLVALLRENSFKGWDGYKVISHDGGLTWGPPIALPIPACHRPTAGWLKDGRALITCRLMQGGKGWVGWWTQNTLACLTDKESLLAPTREEAHTRILPLDYDRSPESDTGYTGWVQFDDGEIYVVNYILDDAPKAQIRGYSLTLEDFMLPAKTKGWQE
ncbi:MAG: glycoside hydrolase [Cephaloticoccus sp.]|nr:glycoside hydrolase [Cephaloticoccus sp.]